MNRRSFACLTAILLIAAAAAPASSLAPSPELMTRMQHVNTGLHSYQADVVAAIDTHGPPYISPTLRGHAYFKQPDKTAVRFDTVPVLAAQFNKLVLQMEPPSEWPSLYEVTPLADDGAISTFRLVRKKNGRIDHVDVTVDDKTAIVTGMTYFYKDNGGSIAVTQSYDQINGNFVPKVQNGKVAIPHYNGDYQVTFSNYKINVPVADTIFQE